VKIESIYISNFKSYSTSGETIPFSTITGFVGANSAGKSNVLEALQLFFFPEKLTEASFHNGDTSRPITIKVAFSDFKGQESFEEKILVRNSRIILARIFSWDILKQQAESKELIPGEMWDYCGRSNCLNPIAIKKISAADLRQFLATEDGARFATQANLGASPTVAAFLDTLEAYWNTVALTARRGSSRDWSAGGVPGR